MAANNFPPGWSYNPSDWTERAPVLWMSLTGFCIASYLGLFQLGVIRAVWEPFFGDGSQRILRESSIAHLLPVPDAFFGAALYLFEAVGESIGSGARWRMMPGIVLLLGAISGVLAVGGVVLAICQSVLFGAYCTLCLASAVCSTLMVGFVMGEVLASLQFLKNQRAPGERARRDPGVVHQTLPDVIYLPTAALDRRRGHVAAELVSAALGIWLMAAPAVLDYGGLARTNDRIAGPVAAAAALIALHEVTRSVRWINLVIGASLIFTPWMFSYEFTALLNDTTVGLLLVGCSLFRGAHRQRMGEGWSCLWKSSSLRPPGMRRQKASDLMRAMFSE